MATIKSFSDLEQSKKLAEILPLESADNVIVLFGSREGTKTVVMPKETLDVIRTPFSDIRETTMCWSLAALLNVLPNRLQIVLAINDFHGDRKEKYVIGSVEHDNYDCYADNLVDTCVAMVEKLHNLKLL